MTIDERVTTLEARQQRLADVVRELIGPRHAVRCTWDWQLPAGADQDWTATQSPELPIVEGVDAWEVDIFARGAGPVQVRNVAVAGNVLAFECRTQVIAPGSYRLRVVGLQALWR